MIDGEPRFATCVTTQPTTFRGAHRDDMAKIILEHPQLGSKILVKLVTMLSARLRQTSARLLQYLDGVSDCESAVCVAVFSCSAAAAAAQPVVVADDAGRFLALPRRGAAHRLDRAEPDRARFRSGSRGPAGGRRPLQRFPARPH